MRMRFFLAIALLLHAMARAHEGHAPLPTKGATVRGDRLVLSTSAAKAIGIAIAKVRLADVRRIVHAVGTVELPWSQQAYVSSLIRGKITEVLVKPGETVSVGQEMARIEGMELESLQLALLQASTELSYGSRLLDGRERLGAESFIPGTVVLETRAEVQKARARLNTAWQKLLAIGVPHETLQHIRSNGERVRTVSITSPIAGVASVADVRPGQMVEPTEHLFHIVDHNRVWVVGKVLEADAGRVRTGLPVQVTFPMFPDKKFTTQIDHVELRLNADRTLSVKAFLDNPDALFKSGMFCRLEIVCGTEKTIVCPKDALIYDRLAVHALVQESPGNYVRKPVEIGQVNGGRAEIKDGLFPGDKVVTTGSHELAALFASPTAKTKSTTGATSVNRENADSRTIAQGLIEIPTSHKLFASAPIDGRVRRILVEHGQSVTKGQLLADLESLEFQSLQLELIQARATLEQLSTNLERLENVATSNAIAQKDLWELQSQHDVAMHRVESLRRELSVIGLSAKEIGQIEETDIANLDSAGDLSAILPVRAPGDGLIAEFDLVPGQVVDRQRSLFEIHDPSRMWVRAFLFEQDAMGVSPGQSVQVTLVSDPTFGAAGRVDRMSPVLVSGNRALSIWIELDNPSRQLKEHMSAVIAIGTGKPAARLAEKAD